ncbi:hypothetical protein KQX54_011683 [Cotesia glomerata]|uniref:Uncharacterized protein n=1 Tax=Cotesia glomerata TaxID=32391 RepID=A0AAV7HXP6_COTGL|nr:hypothetical protein KQX54_011683 [Cotesia glomerata]
MQRMRDSIYFLMSTFFVVTLLFRFSFLPCSHRLKLFYSFPFPSVLLLLLKSAIFKHWLYTSVHACFLSTVKRDYHLGRLEYYLGRRIASIKNNVNGYQKRKSGSKQVSRDGASDGGNGHVGAGAGSSDGNGVPIDNEDTGDEGNHGKNDQSHENIEVEDEEEILIKLRKDVESENDKNDEEDKDGDSKDQVENEEEEEEEGDKSSLNSGDDDELLKLNKDSSQSDREVTPPPPKRRRFETYRSNLKNLEEKVAFLTNQILGNTQHTFQETPGHSFETPEGTQPHIPIVADPELTQTEFLTTPIEPSKNKTRKH